ncbi:hypothetical protein AB2L28_17315 [Kineococcus sp. TBRC 1896]|uniref:Uncharacterized protein n=1 Tax=Kineococcus mangrovi TaxID=1660183 RepID=A0ABV4I5N8_9ACTN
MISTDLPARAQGLRFDVHPCPEGEVWGCRVEHHLTDPAEEPRMDLWGTEPVFRSAD